MTVIIGIDPHKASHTAVAIGRDEQQLADPGENATKSLGWGFLYAFADLRNAHVTLSLEDGGASESDDGAPLGAQAGFSAAPCAYAQLLVSA